MDVVSSSLRCIHKMAKEALSCHPSEKLPWPRSDQGYSSKDRVTLLAPGRKSAVELNDGQTNRKVGGYAVKP